MRRSIYNYIIGTEADVFGIATAGMEIYAWGTAAVGTDIESFWTAIADTGDPLFCRFDDCCSEGVTDLPFFDLVMVKEL